MTPEPVICAHCKAYVLGDSVCPKSLACTECGAKPGRRCKRPSGHTAPQLHANRIERAEAMDIQAGAKWTRGEARQLEMV